MPFFFDWTIVLLIPAAILAFYAQSRVRNAYRKYTQIPVHSGRTGREIAEFLLSANGIHDVAVVPVRGYLGDHYDPRGKHVALSPENYEGASVGASAIAAHEVGHAMQDAQHYTPLRIRSTILPVSNIGSQLSFPLFFVGLLFGSGPLAVLMDVGIALFVLAVLFQVVTLPVEFDASKRALAQLRAHAILSPDELAGGRKMLQAAALTYVAATAMALVNLLRLVILRNSRD